MTRKHLEAQPPAYEAQGETLRDYEQRLRDAGQFVTVQRRAILRYLLRHRSHPTTAQVAQAVGRTGSASLATVYNNLALFAQLELAQVVRAPDGDLHWDLRTDAHHHLLCERCATVSDIDPGDAEVVLHSSQLVARVKRAQVWLVGLCPGCTEPA